MPSETQNILLTGATGFLGRELLCDILRESQATVHCLVRCQNREEGLERLKHVLGAVVDESEIEDRVKIVPGDLGRPGLGMTADQLEQLTKEIDCVLHNGAAVNVVYPYTMLREPNVLGTMECLRIAMAGKGKPFHYVSTSSVLNGFFDKRISSDKTSPASYPIPPGGYTQTKWIGEVLVQQAAERGFSVNIYRPGRIVGHSETGVMNADDLLSKVVQACLFLGIAPEASVPLDLSPVDAVSGAILKRVLGGAGESAIFEIVPRTETDWTDFLSWLQRQVPSLEVVPAERWLEELELKYGASTNTDLQAVRAVFGGEAPTAAVEEEQALYLENAGAVAAPMSYRKVTLGGPEVDELAVAKWLMRWDSNNDRN